MCVGCGGVARWSPRWGGGVRTLCGGVGGSIVGSVIFDCIASSERFFGGGGSLEAL